MGANSFLSGAIAPLLVASFLASPFLARAAGKEKVLYRFQGGNADGETPLAGLLPDATGDLFGTTVAGGSATYGTIFELQPAEHGRWTETPIHVFAGPPDDGAAPWGGLIADSSGNLYGTTRWGGRHFHGTVFVVQNIAGTWTETLIHTFRGAHDGSQPTAGLVMDSAGNLYGATYRGGATANGTVFELQRVAGGGWSESVIHSFAGGNSDGAFPQAGLMIDSAGNLYGTTSGGGPNNLGSAFELTPAAGGDWTESVLHFFEGGSGDGANPTSSLVRDTKGNLYGTAPKGGTHTNSGVVFELSPSGGTWTKSIIRSFGQTATDGSVPSAGLVLDAAGNLYGTTSGGGTHQHGTVFELTPSGSTWTEALLYSFGAHPADGNSPGAALIFDSLGNLYGTTTKGGVKKVHGGTVFELSPAP